MEGNSGDDSESKMSRYVTPAKILLPRVEVQLGWMKKSFYGELRFDGRGASEAIVALDIAAHGLN